MWTPDYYVRIVDLPPSVRGITTPNDDGSFDIYISGRLSEEKRSECLKHELHHIRLDHFYREARVSDCEREAEGASRLRRNVFTDRPEGTVPCFKSLSAFRRYVAALEAQYAKR